MTTVMARVKQVKQPYGGYIKPKEFSKVVFNDQVVLNSEENIHVVLIGIVVDYLMRFMNGTPVEDAFHISLLGADRAFERDNANELLKEIKALDDDSIFSACRLVGYDVCFRKGMKGFKPVEEISPNKETIENIRIMVSRCLVFIEMYGPIVLDGVTFEGGYTRIVTKGDADFLTKDALWDLKVSKQGPTNAHTLQLLVYYLLGKRSIHSEFDCVSVVGIFNPRLNTVYQLDIADVDSEVIKSVEIDVLGCGK